MPHTSSQNFLRELDKKLWTAAEKLRSNLDAAVYKKRILDQGTGATVQGIKASLLKTIPIEFPPLAVQQRIVGLLDEMFEGIATAKANAAKNLQNARALFESHLQSVFTQRGEGWVDRQLATICHEITVGHVG